MNIFGGVALNVQTFSDPSFPSKITLTKHYGMRTHVYLTAEGVLTISHSVSKHRHFMCLLLRRILLTVIPFRL